MKKQPKADIFFWSKKKKRKAEKNKGERKTPEIWGEKKEEGEKRRRVEGRGKSSTLPVAP